jgi:hypothetical protein
MSCYCDFDYTWRVYTTTTRTARKVHRCIECGANIQPKEQYEYVSAIGEEGPYAFKTCARCIALRDYVEAHVPCMCWSHHAMHNDVIETAREYAHEAPGLLFGAYRRMVIAERAAKASKALS